LAYLELIGRRENVENGKIHPIETFKVRHGRYQRIPNLSWRIFKISPPFLVRLI